MRALLVAVLLGALPAAALGGSPEDATKKSPAELERGIADAHPDLEPSGDPALFSSLSEVLGRPLNEYAFGDLKGLRGTIQRVLDWDERTPNGFTPKTKFASAWKDTRAGLEKLRDYLRANAGEIRRQRKANGLGNRTTD